MTESLRDTLGREAGEAESRAEAEEQGAIVPMPGQRGRRKSADPAQVYTVRIPVSQIEKLRVVASQRGRRPSVLIREWTLERLEEFTDSGLKLGKRRQKPGPVDLTGGRP